MEQMAQMEQIEQIEKLRQMGSSNIMDELTKCNNCKRIYNYYDFLAHSETCYLMPNTGSNSETSSATSEDNNPNVGLVINKSKLQSYRDNILKPRVQRSLGNSFNMYYNPSTINFNLNFNNNLEELMHTIPMSIENANNPIQSLTNQLDGIEIDSGNLYGSLSGSISREELKKYTQQIQIAIPFECPICLTTHNTGTEYLAIKCGHIFCIDCSIKWFKCKPLCPLCKCDIRH